MSAFITYGSLASLGEEATYGTLDTRTVAIRCSSIAAPQVQPFSPNAEMYADGNAGVMPVRHHKSGRRDADLTITTKMRTAGHGLLLKAALGSVTTQADTPSSGNHTHTYKLDDLSVGHSAEVWLGTGRGGASSLSQTMTGLICSSATWVLAAHNEIESTYAFIVQDKAVPAAAGSKPTLASGNPIYHNLGGQASWNSGNHGFTRATIRLNNGLIRRDEYGTETTLQPFVTNQRSVVCELEVPYTGNAWQAAKLAETLSDLVFTHTLTSPHVVKFTLHQAQVVNVTPPSQNGYGLMTQTVTLNANADVANSKSGLEIEVINSQSSGTAA